MARTRGDVEIAYESHGRTDRDAPTVVLVHGWAGNRTVWSRQIEVLAEFRPGPGSVLYLQIESIANDRRAGAAKEELVGVLIVMTVPGDTAQFEAFVAGNRQLVEELTDKAKAAGCTSHKFAVGDGQILVVDEWDTADHFQGFIGSPEIQQVMGQMGATGEPTVTVGEAKGFPGEF